MDVLMRNDGISRSNFVAVLGAWRDRIAEWEQALGL